MSLSNLALIVYFVVLSFLINEMMFSYLDQSKSLKLFSWRNILKVTSWMIDENEGMLRMHLAGWSWMQRCSEGLEVHFIIYYLSPTHRIQKCFCFGSAKAHLEHTHCETWLSWFMCKRHTSLSLHPICFVCVYFIWTNKLSFLPWQ